MHFEIAITKLLALIILKLELKNHFSKLYAIFNRLGSQLKKLSFFHVFDKICHFYKFREIWSCQDFNFQIYFEHFQNVERILKE